MSCDSCCCNNELMEKSLFMNVLYEYGKGFIEADAKYFDTESKYVSFLLTLQKYELYSILENFVKDLENTSYNYILEYCIKNENLTPETKKIITKYIST